MRITPNKQYTLDELGVLFSTSWSQIYKRFPEELQSEQEVLFNGKPAILRFDGEVQT